MSFFQWLVSFGILEVKIELGKHHFSNDQHSNYVKTCFKTLSPKMNSGSFLDIIIYCTKRVALTKQTIHKLTKTQLYENDWFIPVDSDTSPPPVCYIHIGFAGCDYILIILQLGIIS